MNSAKVTCLVFWEGQRFRSKWIDGMASYEAYCYSLADTLLDLVSANVSFEANMLSENRRSVLSEAARRIYNLHM